MKLEPPIPTEVFAAIQAPFLEAEAISLDAPILQPLGLLLDLAGETMRERLFVVQGDGPEACLRPDFTVPALRAHIESGRPSGRYFYSGHAFRVAPRGVDRPEEFPQVGLEAFEANDTALADAEMAALAWRSALAGGRDDLTLLMGDVSLFGAFVDGLGLAAPLTARLKRAVSSPRRLNMELAAAERPAAAPSNGGGHLSKLLSSLSEQEAVGVLEEIWALSGVEPVGGRGAGEIVHRLAERAHLAASPRLSADQSGLIRQFLGISGEPEACLRQIEALAGVGASAIKALISDWARRLTALETAGAPRERMRFSAAFGRAFGYYDGVVFEVRSQALGEARPVAGGGRYDGLFARLGAKASVGAVGCMVRPGRAWKEAAA